MYKSVYMRYLCILLTNFLHLRSEHISSYMGVAEGIVPVMGGVYLL